MSEVFRCIARNAHFIDVCNRNLNEIESPTSLSAFWNSAKAGFIARNVLLLESLQQKEIKNERA